MLCTLFFGALALVVKVTIVVVAVLSAIILGLKYYVDNGFPLPLRCGTELYCIALHCVTYSLSIASISYNLFPRVPKIRKVSDARSVSI